MRRIPLLLACTALLAGCGLQPASQFIPEVEAGPVLDQYPGFDGAPIVVSSKDFTEQLVLGKMTSLVLSAAGAKVTDKTNIKGSVNARLSMLGGDVDVMWEYTGTGWIVYLGHTDPIIDPDEQFQAVAEQDLAENGIVWTQPAPLNNTYAIAVKQATADQYGLVNISDITKVPVDERTFCLEAEFINRNDGFVGMQEAYGFTSADIPPGNVQSMEAGLIYNRIGGSCTFGEVFDTDGRIPANGLVTLVDDEHFFPIYEPALTVRQEIYEAYPQIGDIFADLASRLTTDVMRGLNAQVDVDGLDPVFVAEDWLKAQGFLAS
ncbi:glycine betaine ABC transporter substrate-binding protein [Phytomonospora sp. NPDC050363]|uniref:glycine betaine ABC transporter substrate-binding protein n=1 Tax=Phytomonospora sp. NPDC050363 TaxID=3155642 RepID=UPI00340A501E